MVILGSLDLLPGFRIERGHDLGGRAREGRAIQGAFEALGLLVCLAACFSMLQVNALLGMHGKTGDSFVVMDLMRLPLGILSGMGFIGGGAILRKDGFVTGVTTAATLWFVTVIGLCFGGGPLAFGWIGVALALLILAVVKVAEKSLPQNRATLIVRVEKTGPAEAELRAMLRDSGMAIESVKFDFFPVGENRRLEYQLVHRERPRDHGPPAIVEKLLAREGVSLLRWVD